MPNYIAIFFRVIIITYALTSISCNDKYNKTKQLPNVIFIYADDLGQGMLSCKGQKIVTTPNIDRLAKDGLYFENARGCMFCAPARASLLTGYNDVHNNKWKITEGGAYKEVFEGKINSTQVSEALYKQTSSYRDEKIITLAEVFKQAGYVTGQIGKLEWGFSVSFEEMKQHGWDYYYGYLDHVMAHGFYPPYMYENGERIDIYGNTRKDCGKTLEHETEHTFNERWNMKGKAKFSQNIFFRKNTILYTK